MRRLSLPTFLALAASLGVSGPASAHLGPVDPTMLQARANNPEQLLLGTNFGLVVHSGAGSDWQVICSEAIGYNELFNPVVHWSADGALFAGSLVGLFVSRDGGCSWDPVEPFTTRGASDIRSAPTEPTTVFVTTGKVGSVSNGLFRSDDDGKSFAPTVLVRDELMFTGIRFAPSSPETLYVSGWWYSPSNTATLFRSLDGAQTFQELAPVLPAAGGFTVLAVHPTDPDTLYASVRVDPEEGNEYLLLRSIDGGATFSEVARDDFTEFRDVVFSPDGQRIWSASGQRLYHSSNGGDRFTRLVSPRRSGCVNEIGGTLFVCGSTAGDGWALSTVEGGTPADPVEGVPPLDTLLRFSSVRPLECPAGTPGKDICDPLWVPLALAIGADPGELPFPEDQDGGTTLPDAGPQLPDGGVGPQPEPVGCGCGGAGSGALAWAALLLLALARRVRGRYLAGLLLVLAACGPPPPGPPPPADPCVPNPCAASGGLGVCVVENGVASCRPESIDPCSPNPCTQPHRSVCTTVGDAASCACDAGFRLVDGACEEERPVDCSAQHPDGDAFEPDECPVLARDIGGSGSQDESHTLFPSGDVDWFRIDASADRAFRFRVNGSGGGVRLDLFAGETLDPIGTHASAAGSLDLAIKARSTGRIHARVRGTAEAGATGYTISIADLGPDDWADEPSGAVTIQPDEPFAGLFQFNGDQDVFAFEVAERSAWRFEGACATTGDEALRLEVLSPDGVTVTYRDQGSPLIADFHAAGAGTWYLRISEPTDRFGVGYGFQLTSLGGDDHGNHAGEATALPVGISTPATLEREGDVDAFRFTAIERHIYRVHCAPSDFGNCSPELLDGHGHPVANVVAGGGGELFVEAAVDGAYTVLVSGSGAGAYAIRVEDQGVDDHGDDLVSATTVVSDPFVSGSATLELPGDRDVLTFLADVDHIYRIVCTRRTLGACNIRVMNATGLPVASDVNGGDGLVLYEFNGGGIFYVEFSAAGGAWGTYDWSIEDLLHDDHMDDVFTATLVAANGAWVNGIIETPNDRDHFWFTPSAERIYRITCQRQTLPDCHLRLFDMSERLLDSDLNGGDAELRFKAASNAPLSFQVRAPPGQLGTYLVKTEDLGTDDHGDTPQTASSIPTNGAPGAGRFDFAGDEDWFKFFAPAGQTLQISGSGGPVLIDVVAPDQTTVASSGVLPHSFTATVAGTWYLKVRSLVPGGMGGYTLVVKP